MLRKENLSITKLHFCYLLHYYMHFVCSVDGFPACPLSFNQVWIIYLSEPGEMAKEITTTTSQKIANKKNVMWVNEAKSTFANRISPEQMLFWFVFSLVYGVRFLCFWWLMLFPRYHTYGSAISSHHGTNSTNWFESTMIVVWPLVLSPRSCSSTFSLSFSVSLFVYVDALVQVCALKLVCENTITIGLYRANAIVFDTCSNSFFLARFS